MGSHWLLWMLLLTSSSSAASIKGQSDAAGYLLWDGTCHLSTLPFPLLETEERRREPIQPVTKECNETYTSDEYLAGFTSRESVKSPSRRMRERMSRLLGIPNSYDTSRLLTSLADMSQMLIAVNRQQDLLYSPEQELLINSTANMMKMAQDSPTCCANSRLPQNCEPLLIYTEDYYNSCSHQSRLVAPDLTLVDLVSYLVSLTSGRQFYLVYDDATKGVEEVVLAFQESFGDTVLLQYEPSLELLREVLTSSYHVHPMRNVFLLCSAKHIADVFEMVRDKVLESPTVQWFAIVDKDMTQELPLLLREGTQVALVQRLTRQKAQLFSSRVNPDGQIRFHQVGWWSVKDTWQTNSPLVKGGLVPDLQQLYSDFQGRQLLISTNDDWPYFKIEKLESGAVIPLFGIDFSIVKTLSEKLNFTYKVITPPDGMWGGPKADGTITGLVGQVARHEAHATLCELTITDVRESVVDFTMPYYLEFATLVSPAPKEKNRAFAILSPFTVEVWLYIMLATVLLGPLLYLETRLLVVGLRKEDSPHYSLQSFSFNMYRNLVLQGNLIDSHLWALRFIFFFWYLFCLYMYAMYSGTLTAALAFTSFERPINSLYDLSRAHRDGYTIAIGKDTNFDATFREAKGGIYKEVWRLFNHEEPEKSFVPTRNMGLDLVEYHKGVYINAHLSIKLEVMRRGRYKFYIGKETFLPQGYGIACSSGSPFKDVFSLMVIQMVEAGLVNRWINDEVNRVSKFGFSSTVSGPQAISLQHLQAAFFIMILGFAISSSVLLLEILAIVLLQNINQAS